MTCPFCEEIHSHIDGNLAYAKYDGFGVPENTLNAYVWYSGAAAPGLGIVRAD